MTDRGDWTDPTLAASWTADATEHNPLRREQLDILLTIMSDFYRPGSAILDLGFGSGLIEAMIFERIPDAYVIGVDSSPAMMALAAERLQPHASQYEAIQHDMAQIDRLALPDRPIRIALASQSLHHLSADAMDRAYGFLYDRLEPGGLFLLVDRVAVESPAVFEVYQSVWRRFDRVNGSGVASHEGATYDDQIAMLAGQRDQPQTVPWHLDHLQQAGFAAACLHKHANRALIAARKPHEEVPRKP